MRPPADIADRGISQTQRRTLWSACAAHIMHDGYTDLIYILLPVWQTEFGIGFGALALVRGLYAGSMAGLQIPVGHLSHWVSGRTILTTGMVLAAVGYALAGFSTGMVGLCAALTLSGCGSSTQHPIASAAISQAYGKEARRPLSIYNFSGDLGKAAIPASASLLITFMTWRQALWVIAAVGMIGAVGLAIFVPTFPKASAADPTVRQRKQSGRGGFALLFAIGVLDTSVRMMTVVVPALSLERKGCIARDHWRVAFLGLYWRRGGKIRLRMAGCSGWRDRHGTGDGGRHSAGYFCGSARPLDDVFVLVAAARRDVERDVLSSVWNGSGPDAPRIAPNALLPCSTPVPSAPEPSHPLSMASWVMRSARWARRLQLLSPH